MRHARQGLRGCDLRERAWLFSLPRPCSIPASTLGLWLPLRQKQLLYVHGLKSQRLLFYNQYFSLEEFSKIPGMLWHQICLLTVNLEAEEKEPLPKCGAYF